MIELYAAYIKEREDRECVYNSNSFVTYKEYDDSVSIYDIYTRPENRGSGELKKMIDELFNSFARKGKNKIYGYTDPSTKGWENSDRLMRKYGFKLIETKNDNYNHYILFLGDMNGE